MAKGNLFLGTAGNSVGDVVMYRREGSQVSRVRVRKVKNPKTDAQSLQRAAFSPVAKFYSPLAVVLERSFEGLSKSKSYAKFLKTNVDLARANGWLLPKGTGFFPLPYRLSQGTLPQISYSIMTGLTPGFNIGETQTSTIGGLSEAFVAAGYQNGDIVTIILVSVNGPIAATGSFSPVAVQFAIDTTSTQTISAAFSGRIVISNGPSGASFNVPSGSNCAAGAIIVARFENEKWRRSTQDLAVDTGLMTAITAADYKAEAIASYGPNAGDPNPLVYLDGDTLEG